LIEMYRDTLLYGKLPELADSFLVFLFGIIMFVFGSWLFRKLSPGCRGSIAVLAAKKRKY